MDNSTTLEGTRTLNTEPLTVAGVTFAVCTACPEGTHPAAGCNEHDRTLLADYELNYLHEHPELARRRAVIISRAAA